MNVAAGKATSRDIHAQMLVEAMRQRPALPGEHIISSASLIETQDLLE